MIKKIVYFLLDILTLKRGVQRKINGIKIRFPARWCRYYENNYEPENYSFLKEHVKKGMHIIDIGAHLGLFSVYCSKLIHNEGKIFCFEPTAGTYSVLKETLELNKCINVVPIRAAVSSQTGKTVFYVSETAGCNSNSLIKNKSEKEITGEEVQLVTIDTEVKKYGVKPSLIKIDAEGAELDVLTGAMDTLKTFHPILILGLHPDFISIKGDSLQQIWSVLHSTGYRVYFDNKEFSEKDFINQTNLFDVHCIPL